MSYRKWLFALTYTGLSLVFSVNAVAGLTVKSTSSSSCSSPCPDGSCPVDGVCSTSKLGGSIFALFTGDLPLPVLYPMPGGKPDFWLDCDQSGKPCPYGVPTVTATGTMTVSKSSKTITGNFGTGSGFPSTVPFKIQVAGSIYNDGIYTVISNTGTVLTLLERPNRNEVSAFMVALSNIKWTITYANQDSSSASYVGSATAYMRYYYDDAGQCVTNPNLVGNTCEEGWASVSGYFNAQSYCTWDSNTGSLVLPCEVQAYAGDGQWAEFTFDVGNHNFANCSDGGSACYIAWADPDKVNSGTCKKYFPATNVFQECQTLKFTINAGTGISDFWHRAWNSAMTSAAPQVTGDHQTSTAAHSAVSVTVNVSPNPVQIGASSTSLLTVTIQNSPEANLGLIDVNTVGIVFEDSSGNKTIVYNDKAPYACTDGNCWKFKFNRSEVFCAYASTHPESVQNNLLSVPVIPINVVGNYPNSANGIEGTSMLSVNYQNGGFDVSTCPVTP